MRSKGQKGQNASMLTPPMSGRRTLVCQHRTPPKETDNGRFSFWIPFEPTLRNVAQKKRLSRILKTNHGCQGHALFADPRPYDIMKNTTFSGPFKPTLFDPQNRREHRGGKRTAGQKAHPHMCKAERSLMHQQRITPTVAHRISFKHKLIPCPICFKRKLIPCPISSLTIKPIG